MATDAPEEYQEDLSRMQFQKVLEAMERLKENYRMILTLRYMEGYDDEEISEILEISPANTRTMLSRAKESLRTKMDYYEAEER